MIWEDAQVLRHNTRAQNRILFFPKGMSTLAASCVSITLPLTRNCKGFWFFTVKREDLASGLFQIPSLFSSDNLQTPVTTVHSLMCGIYLLLEMWYYYLTPCGNLEGTNYIQLIYFTNT